MPADAGAAREPERTETPFRGSLFSVDVETWPGNSRREVARHPGGCGAVVLLDGGRVLLIRQFREAVRREILEVPAGVLDVEGESPEDAVRREIEEETGYRALSVERLSAVLSSPGFTDERIELFLVRAEEPEGGEAGGEAGIERVVVTLDEAVGMARRGEIEDAKSALALLLAAERAGMAPPPARDAR